jgi:hypothetical protein
MMAEGNEETTGDFAGLKEVGMAVKGRPRHILIFLRSLKI